ncbi:hypothetical protein K469DRAFT_279080 [Zopfia rhizophila CBS 207.26]|uniref:Uncharacterized protein n=1 Tax=Zopfia rhizophila CBS 207.26 TaxID=1314779 RepID=A0A6A6DLS6_9PEZI|nr:hypothetical protein K469DRAFT_279080 [Zopfia rhizophila CBS 207.26]
MITAPSAHGSYFLRVIFHLARSIGAFLFRSFVSGPLGIVGITSVPLKDSALWGLLFEVPEMDRTKVI